LGIPTLVSTDPADSEVSVYRNKVVTATFSEALLPSSVTAANFLLKNYDVGENVDAYVSLSSDGTVVSVTPTRVLYEDTTYLLTIIGADVNSVSPVKSSSTSSNLATTARVFFQTGTEIDTPGLTKTDDQKDLEGDLGLPSNIQVQTPVTNISIVSTSPANRQFALSPSLSEISVTFSAAPDTSTFTANTFQVQISPYYPEDEDFLAFPNANNDGKCNYQWQGNNDTSTEAPFDYSDPTGTLSFSGSTAIWTKTGDGDFPSNTKVRLLMSSLLADTDGNSLGDDYEVTFYIEPCPYAASVDAVRDQFRPYVLATWPDDLIGKTIYKNTLEAMSHVRWNYDLTKIHHSFREYVLYRTVDDIFQGLTLETDIKAGVFKKLGDLVIRYDVRTPDYMPRAQKDAITRWKNALDRMRRIYVSVPNWFIKGYTDIEQRQYWRNRHWRIDVARALQGSYPLREIAGNTRAHRATKGPGAFDMFS